MLFHVYNRLTKKTLERKCSKKDEVRIVRAKLRGK
jgi:hypothetical protein